MTSRPDPKDGPPAMTPAQREEYERRREHWAEVGKPLSDAIHESTDIRAEDLALRVLLPEGGPRADARAISLLYFEAEKRFIEAAEGNHDGICSGAGCGKCFLEGVQPLLAALRASGAGTRQEESPDCIKRQHSVFEAALEDMAADTAAPNVQRWAAGVLNDAFDAAHRLTGTEPRCICDGDEFVWRCSVHDPVNARAPMSERQVSYEQLRREVLWCHDVLAKSPGDGLCATEEDAARTCQCETCERLRSESRPNE